MIEKKMFSNTAAASISVQRQDLNDDCSTTTSVARMMEKGHRETSETAIWSGTAKSS
ncbi:hypothetical protein OK016_02910 [Vibrio chagasii]|nr:hypothetical protein [Vibrio chagasii]